MLNLFRDKLRIRWIHIIKISQGNVGIFDIFEYLGCGSVVFPQKLFETKEQSISGLISLAPGGVTENGNFLQPDLFILGVIE